VYGSVGEMSTDSSERASLLAALVQVIRMASGAGVVLSQTVANHVGLNPADMECLDLLLQEGPSTAGRLAEVTGFTTGSVTGLIDRLEAAGYVRRAPNPRDRRSVLVEPIIERIERDIGPYYAAIRRSMDALAARFSDEELRVVLRFFEQMYTGSLAEIDQLRKQLPPAPRDEVARRRRTTRGER
jgi:DNA-binding MarR family transcriptional regulator